jgi:arylsulfatase A-like enzyme
VVRLVLVVLCATGLACEESTPSPRPSIALVVIDTLRADAVSAYGAREETTPNFDALAAAGRLYTRAYAPSPWTLPSHASLLTGVGVEQHGVGLHGQVVLGEGALTLAERLQAAGYETAGFSENALVSPAFGFGQGFDHFSVRSADEQFAANQSLVIDVRDELARWLDAVDPQDPFFVFVNLYDPHEPYRVRRENPFLPASATTAQGKQAGAGQRTSHRICDRVPNSPQLELLRGLYLGEVAVADQKLGSLLDLLRARAAGGLITVVTSDHGEHFGEHRLLDHEFSVREQVLHVPLVVSGAGLGAATIDTPVELRDITASLLRWAGADTSSVEGAALPDAGTTAAGESLVALYSDTRLRLPARFDRSASEESRHAKRAGCTEGDRVFGDMVAVTRYPYKLNWYERYPSELFDLRAGTAEQVEQPEVFRALEAQAQEFVERAGLGGERAGEPLSPETEAALRQLGYLD